jgi:putative thiamine transport system substrate-binding protein
MCVASPALADWQATLDAAPGQTVYWNASGGDERTNSFISWAGQGRAGQETERLYGIKIEQVKLTDPAEAVTRVIAEIAAGNAEEARLTLSGSTDPISFR